MQIRNDYKYALIKEFSTYWDAFDNVDEMYLSLIQSHKDLPEYFSSKNRGIVYSSGVVEKIIYSQNQLWIVYYSQFKKTLTAMRDFKKDNTIKELQSNTKWICKEIIVDTADYAEEDSDWAVAVMST